MDSRNTNVPLPLRRPVRYLSLVTNVAWCLSRTILDLVNVLLRPLEVWLQRCPALFVVIGLDFCTLLQTPVCNSDHQTALKHEGHASLSDLHWRQACIRCFLVCCCVWTMGRHDIMQGCTGGLEPTACLSIILSVDQAHELGHGVPMVPRRPERVFLHQPTRRKDDKVRHCCPRMITLGSEDSEDRWVRMIEADTANGVEPA